MIFQVQKDTSARLDKLPNDARAFGGVQLHTNFVGNSGVAHGRHDPLGGRGRRYIQGNDETGALVRHRCRVYRVYLKLATGCRRATMTGWMRSRRTLCRPRPWKPRTLAVL